MSADWTTSTEFIDRFEQAVTLLCHGLVPPRKLVEGWLSKTDESLQDFAADNGPAWAQGIVVLDAAALLAETPTEGVNHGAKT